MGGNNSCEAVEVTGESVVVVEIIVTDVIGSDIMLLDHSFLNRVSFVKV